MKITPSSRQTSMRSHKEDIDKILVDVSRKNVKEIPENS